MIVPLLLAKKGPAVAVALKLTGFASTLSRALKKTFTCQRPREVCGRATLTAVTEPAGGVSSKSTAPLQVSLKMIGDVFSPVEESIVAVPLPRSVM